MSIRINGFNADVSVEHVRGAPGIGCPTLHFTLRWLIHEKTSHAPARVTQLDGSVVVPESSSRYLGRLIPHESLAVLETREKHDERQTHLKVELDASRIEAIEAVRAGGDLRVELHLRALIQCGEQIQEGHADVTRIIEQGTWVRILGEMQYQKRLLLEVPVPSSNADKSLAGAVSDLKKAQGSLVLGEYRDVVAKCRHALELLETALKVEESSLPQFEWKTNKTDEKAVRLRLLKKALHHFTHPAHHSDERAVDIEYTRKDAVCSLSMTASLLTLYMNPN